MRGSPPTFDKSVLGSEADVFVGCEVFVVLGEAVECELHAGSAAHHKWWDDTATELLHHNPTFYCVHPDVYTVLTFTSVTLGLSNTNDSNMTAM